MGLRDHIPSLVLRCLPRHRALAGVGWDMRRGSCGRTRRRRRRCRCRCRRRRRRRRRRRCRRRLRSRRAVLRRRQRIVVSSDVGVAAARSATGSRRSLRGHHRAHLLHERAVVRDGRGGCGGRRRWRRRRRLRPRGRAGGLVVVVQPPVGRRVLRPIGHGGQYRTVAVGPASCPHPPRLARGSARANTRARCRPSSVPIVRAVSIAVS